MEFSFSGRRVTVEGLGGGCAYVRRCFLGADGSSVRIAVEVSNSPLRAAHVSRTLEEWQVLASSILGAGTASGAPTRKRRKAEAEPVTVVAAPDGEETVLLSFAPPRELGDALTYLAAYMSE